MALTKITDKSLEDSKAAITKALSEVGFGILTEIDVAKTLKAKIDVDRDPLVILGACNPTFANQALTHDPAFALMMPCNVVLAETPSGTSITIVDPRELINDPELQQLASDAYQLLSKALEQA